ncbi:MAG: hypothetical protein KKH34_09845 [Candidatus Omnitrophica bacterium]|nr:hypothetical protein [Candidatus Omnitrophota bacterium]MCG2703017.1 hypothetical protein [Candidatus Omnitrophota bacterium]
MGNMFKKNNKAQAMVIVFVYLSIVSLIGIYLMTYAMNLHDLAVREIYHSRAYYLAEAALIINLTRLYTGLAVIDFPEFSPITVTVVNQNMGVGNRRLVATVDNWMP